MAAIQLTINGDPSDIEEGSISQLIVALKEIKPDCERLGLEATSDLIKVIVDRWERYHDKRLLMNQCPQLAVCLENELKRRVCFVLPKSSQDRYTTPYQGWEQIVLAFPAAGEDVEEMNYCLAFGRQAAAIFHALLVVEHGVVDLGVLIGVQDPKPGWDATCRLLEKILAAGRSNATEEVRKHFSFLELVNKDIQSMKMAWRNKISHAEGKLVVMTSDFKPQVAEKIISACHGFMLLLATDGPRVKP